MLCIKGEWIFVTREHIWALDAIHIFFLNKGFDTMSRTDQETLIIIFYFLLFKD